MTSTFTPYTLDADGNIVVGTPASTDQVVAAAAVTGTNLPQAASVANTILAANPGAYVYDPASNTSITFNALGQYVTITGMPTDGSAVFNIDTGALISASSTGSAFSSWAGFTAWASANSTLLMLGFTAAAFVMSNVFGGGGKRR